MGRASIGFPTTRGWGLGVGRDWADKDFYRVLGVEPTSPPEEITKSYRTCMKIVHPDTNNQDPEIQATANRACTGLRRGIRRPIEPSQTQRV